MPSTTLPPASDGFLTLTLTLVPTLGLTSGQVPEASSVYSRNPNPNPNQVPQGSYAVCARCTTLLLVEVLSPTPTLPLGTTFPEP